ncbi:MAG: DUF4288 domain-containing protein [Bacteroidia bacterium]|nr:DUF4288 domain-containing protein [Bacteroidia bacterium]
MSMYLAKIVFHIICGDSSKQQFDEQLRLISAEDQSNAIEKASNLGLNEEVHFANNNNNPVHWKFIGVSELIRLDNLEDGSEIYSSVKVKKNPESFINSVKLRYERINLMSFQES